MLRHSIITALCAALLTACSGGGEHTPDNAIAQVGKKTLTDNELSAALPKGLNDADSTAFAQAYIRQWIDRQLIMQVAAEEIDLDEINTLTEQYRADLIMAQYRRAMASQASADFPEDSIRAYYDTHRDDFTLERPMLKGVYLKIPADSPNLRQLRQLYRSNKAADIDRLEKAAISSAIHYDYFRDKWIDLEQIETRIPIEFNADRIAQLRSRQPIDVEHQGFVYLLSVCDYLPAGAPMPYEAARTAVVDRLLSLHRRLSDRQLLDDLYNNATKQQKVKIFKN